MARKCGIISAVIVCVAMVIAIVTNLSLTQKDTDIYTRKFQFLGVFDSQQIKIPAEEELDDEMETSDVIAVVRPTDEIQAYAYSVLQKVEIVKVLRGNETIAGEIWISCSNGIYKDQNWGLSNLMYSDFEYLVVLQELEGQYYNEFYLGAIRLDSEQTWNVIDLAKEYTYNELKKEKYFASNKETLELLYEREQYVLEKVGYE